ncbi:MULTISPECIES: hypothetical protein [unclassified Bartonella]
MSHIVFATGGTTRALKTLRHKSLNYDFEHTLRQKSSKRSLKIAL